MRRLRKNERGVSFVELAILMPLLLILITGIIDYGMAIRTVKRLSFAGKAGARYAASQSVIGTFQCAPANLDATPCAQILAGGFADSIEYFAKWGACDSLNRSGLTGADWEVTVDVVNPANIGQVTGLTGIAINSAGQQIPSGQVVRVNVRRAANAPRYCLVCLEDIQGLAGIKGPKNAHLQSTASSALEGACN